MVNFRTWPHSSGSLEEAFQLKAAIIRSASNDSWWMCQRRETGGKAWWGLLEKSSKTSEWGQEEEPQEEKEGIDSKDIEYLVDMGDQWASTQSTKITPKTVSHTEWCSLDLLWSDGRPVVATSVTALLKDTVRGFNIRAASPDSKGLITQRLANLSVEDEVEFGLSLCRHQT